jgi:predicted phosphoadenosine phosphosulfate sulfurtransferase
MKYLETWKGRCYEDIPDEVPEKLAKINRAPSYKAIAIAILKNDSSLKSLGFQGKHSNWYKILKNKDNPQGELF